MPESIFFLQNTKRLTKFRRLLNQKGAKVLKPYFFNTLLSLRLKLGLIIKSSFIIGIFLALFSWYLTIPPAFVINHQIVKYNDPIIIKAANFKANKPKRLNVMFDDRLFEEQAFPKGSKEYQLWYFMLKDQINLSDITKTGKHQIRVGFPGDNLSEAFAIELKKQIPQFLILNPKLRNDSIMKIQADNNDANIKTDLHIQFDSILFPKGGIPVDSKSGQQWHCNLKNLRLTKEMKKNGKHIIRFRFSDGDFSKDHTIYFQTKIAKKYYLRRQPIKFSDIVFSKLKGKPKNYINNDYLNNENGTITDRGTGLMWQKGGSNYEMYFSEAKKYLIGLNNDRFGGYSDWRLPTIEELASLLEEYTNFSDKKLTSKNSNDEDINESERLKMVQEAFRKGFKLAIRERSTPGVALYINPIFSKKQNHIWSMDTQPSGRPIYVNFNRGLINESYFFDNSCYVRAVRSISISDE